MTKTDHPGQMALETVPAKTALEVTREEQLQKAAPLSMLEIVARAAADPTMDIVKMKELYAMYREEQAFQARIQFNEAMALCQSEMPVIRKDARNSSTNSDYARLETLKRQATPVITKHGFSLQFSQGIDAPDKMIRVKCVVSRGGHEVIHYLDLAIDDVGSKGNPNKTKIHGQGSTFSYGERYLTKLIFNITIAGEDDDGNQGNKPKPAGPSTKAPDSPSRKQLAEELWEITKPIGGSLRNWDARNQWFWDETILHDNETAPNIPAERYPEVIAKTKAKIAAQKK